MIGGIDFTNENSEMKVGNRQVLEVAKGSTILGTFHSWRLPVFSDIISGQTLKFLAPASPMVIDDYDDCFFNNDYLVGSNSRYMVRELNSYDQESAAEDYSWDIMIFTVGIYFIDTATNEQTPIYQCNNRVKTTRNTSTGEVISKQILSTTEVVKLTSFTFPNDFGHILSYGGSHQGLDLQVDNYRTKQKPYTLAPLTSSDDLQNKIVLVSNFPDSIINTLYPNGADTSKEYALFMVDHTWGDYNEWYETLQAVCYPNTIGHDSNWNPINDGYWFVIQTAIMMNQYAICQKKFGASSPTVWNRTAIIGGAEVSIPLGSALNTSSPLYPYVKKVVWGS